MEKTITQFLNETKYKKYIIRMSYPDFMSYPDYNLRGKSQQEQQAEFNRIAAERQTIFYNVINDLVEIGAIIDCEKYFSDNSIELQISGTAEIIQAVNKIKNIESVYPKVSNIVSVINSAVYPL